MKNYLISIIMKEILKKKNKKVLKIKKSIFLFHKPLGFPDIIRDVWTTN